jgi:hypothetical protein
VKYLIAILALVLGALLTPVAYAETIQETWSQTSNLDNNWNVEGRAGVTVSNNRLNVDQTVVHPSSVVIQHKSIVFRRDRVMSVSGWIQSNDLKSSWRETYFSGGLQSISNGNYYGTAAIANWVDDRNGIFGPYFILFANEYQNSSKWWVPSNGQPRIRNNISGQHTYKVEWTPSNSDGSQGKWKFTVDGSSFTSTTLPSDGDMRPVGGFGRGRVTFGPMTMTGTRR